MNLGKRQELFSYCIANLIIKMYGMGYMVRCGDFYAIKRTPLEHKANSLHYDKCAADLNLFKDGKFLVDTVEHAGFGTIWESFHPLCRWGGRYNDGNHYEVTVDDKWRKAK